MTIEARQSTAEELTSEAGSRVVPGPGEPENDAETISKLTRWILSSREDATEIGLDTDLIQEGVLDSLEMVNFILFIEEIRGDEIPEAFIQPEYFVSLRVIYDTFFLPTNRSDPRRASNAE